MANDDKKKKPSAKDIKTGLQNLNLQGDDLKKDLEKGVKKENPLAIKVKNKVRACKSSQAGIALEIRNFKALKIKIGDVVIPEAHFLKMFPNKWDKFNINISYENNKGEAVKKFYMYIPKNMVLELGASLEVIYRQKLEEYHYTFIMSDITQEEVEG